MLILREENDDSIISYYNSTDVKRSTYNKSENKMTITFVKGERTFLYENVNIKDYTEFEKNKSQGQAIRIFLKKYKHK
jgi:hypothetical protein